MQAQTPKPELVPSLVEWHRGFDVFKKGQETEVSRKAIAKKVDFKELDYLKVSLEINEKEKFLQVIKGLYAENN